MRSRYRKPSCSWRAGVLVLLALVLLAGPEGAGGALPATPLALLDGGTLDFQTLKGQVVVILFLASW